MSLSGNYFTTSTTSLFTNQLSQAALFALYEQSIAREVGTIYDIVNTQGKTVQVPVFGRAQVTATTEGAIMSIDDQWKPTTETINVAEYATAATISDQIRETSAYDLATQLGNVMGGALAQQMDSTAFAAFANFQPASGITAGTSELTASAFFKMAAQLRANLAPQAQGYIGIFHPYVVYNLKRELAGYGGSQLNNPSNLGNEALQTGYVGTIAGIKIYESTVVPAGSLSTSKLGAVFSPAALGIALKRDIRLETQRQALKRGEDVVGSMVMGASALGPVDGSSYSTWGVQVDLDASTSNFAVGTNTD
jgi:N4-gp56 family major capsid protein